MKHLNISKAAQTSTALHFQEELGSDLTQAWASAGSCPFPAISPSGTVVIFMDPAFVGKPSSVVAGLGP